jgi:hypothetical protein
MQRHVSSAVIHGLVGGIVAGAVVALWFFLVDQLSAQPFRTPTLLASVFMGGAVQEPTLGLIATYTVLHFGVFAVLGGATAVLLETTGTVAGLLMGLVFGFGVLNTVHYGSLLVADASFLTVLPVAHVVLANLAGGMALMAYLHYALHPADPIGLGVLVRYPLMARGLGTGMVGAAAVAVWFFVLDLATSRPFHTPAALGSALLVGATSPAEIQVSWATIGAYTVVHLAAFAVVGVAFTWVARRLEQMPSWWLLALMAFIVLEGLFVATVGIVSAWVLGAIGWWAVAVGNLVGVGAMAKWVLAARPELQKRLFQEPVATNV